MHDVVSLRDGGSDAEAREEEDSHNSAGEDGGDDAPAAAVGVNSMAHGIGHD